jgi:hypothetical protein
MTSVHICAPQPVKVEPRLRVLPNPWFLSFVPGEQPKPFPVVESCGKCAAFVKVLSRTFEYREYDESTMGVYDGWYVVGVHYDCKRCGYKSEPHCEPEATA